jgi:hypothetical protein
MQRPWEMNLTRRRRRPASSGDLCVSAGVSGLLATVSVSCKQLALACDPVAATAARPPLNREMAGVLLGGT